MRRLVSSQAKKHGKFGTALSGKAAFECMSNNVPAAFDCENTMSTEQSPIK